MKTAIAMREDKMAIEYIDRAAVEKFIEAGLNNPDAAKRFGHDAIEIMAEVHYMPAADVAPVVHGRWEKHYRSGTPVAEGYVSTCCDMWNNRKSNYCPDCGKKMDGGNS